MTQIQKRFSVALDINRPVSNRAFEVVEGDNGNIIDITLTDDGQAVDLGGCRVLAVFSKSNGTSSQDSAVEGGGVSVEENRVRISLFIPSFAPGMVECELQVYSGAAQTTLVTSAKFNFKCRRGILNPDAVKATDEHPLLVGLIEQCGSLEQSFSGFSLEEQARRASEQARAYAENERAGAEAQRKLTEAGRAANEMLRASAEGVRQALYGEIASAYESGAFKGDQGDKGDKGDKGDMGDVSYHAFQHATGGSDALSPAAIGAAAASHAHGGITNDGKIGTAADKAVYTGALGVLQAGILPVAAGGTGGTDAATGRANLGAASAADMTTVNTSITALQKAATTLFATAGTAPAFTVADTSVAAYASGLRRTVQFHADSAAVTLNFNGKGAVALYERTGKQMSVKAGQVVEVCHNGTYFFGVSPGGGVEFPATPSAGDTTVFAYDVPYHFSDMTSYVAAPYYGFTANIAGTYRVVFKSSLYSDTKYSTCWQKLQKNDSDVSGSEVYYGTETTYSGGTVSKTIDMALAVGDTIRVFVRRNGNSGASFLTALRVGLLAADVQTEINKYLTQVST